MLLLQLIGPRGPQLSESRTLPRESCFTILNLANLRILNLT